MMVTMMLKVSEQSRYHAARAQSKPIMLGEGWVTYTGDENSPVHLPISLDERHRYRSCIFRRYSKHLKSGYPNEGAPALYRWQTY